MHGVAVKRCPLVKITDDSERPIETGPHDHRTHTTDKTWPLQNYRTIVVTISLLEL